MEYYISRARSAQSKHASEAEVEPEVRDGAGDKKEHVKLERWCHLRTDEAWHMQLIAATAY